MLVSRRRNHEGAGHGGKKQRNPGEAGDDDGAGDDDRNSPPPKTPPPPPPHDTNPPSNSSNPTTLNTTNIRQTILQVVNRANIRTWQNEQHALTNNTLSRTTCSHELGRACRSFCQVRIFALFTTWSIVCRMFVVFRSPISQLVTQFHRVKPERISCARPTTRC